MIAAQELERRIARLLDFAVESGPGVEYEACTAAALVLHYRLVAVVAATN